MGGCCPHFRGGRISEVPNRIEEFAGRISELLVTFKGLVVAFKSSLSRSRGSWSHLRKFQVPFQSDRVWEFTGRRLLDVFSVLLDFFFRFLDIFRRLLDVFRALLYFDTFQWLLDAFWRWSHLNFGLSVTNSILDYGNGNGPPGTFSWDCWA